MKELIQNTAELLTDIHANLDKLDGLDEAVANAEARLRVANTSLAEVIESLESKKGYLDSNRVAALAEHDSMMFEKTKALRQLSAEIETAKNDLADLHANIRAASAQHDHILASLDSLRKKLA